MSDHHLIANSEWEGTESEGCAVAMFSFISHSAGSASSSADAAELDTGRRVLCIPATSAPSERVFSAAGLTIANRRASLNAENAAALIFLHDSWGVVEKLEELKAVDKDL